jgi:hypothetical protein
MDQLRGEYSLAMSSVTEDGVTSIKDKRLYFVDVIINNVAGRQPRRLEG